MASGTSEIRTPSGWRRSDGSRSGRQLALDAFDPAALAGAGLFRRRCLPGAFEGRDRRRNRAAADAPFPAKPLSAERRVAAGRRHDGKRRETLAQDKN